MTLAEVHVKWLVILMDLLGSDIFFTLWLKRQVLHREWAHLKVLCWSLVLKWTSLQKVAFVFVTFEWNKCGCEKTVPVSESFCSNLKFLRVIDLTEWLWWWNVGVNGIRLVFSFSAVCSAYCRSICWAQWWRGEQRKQNSQVRRKTAHCLWFFGNIRVVTT